MKLIVIIENSKYSIMQKLAALAASFCMMQVALANPQGGSVVSGNVTITQTQNNTQVVQQSQQAIINWQSFNIGAGQSTHFNQVTGGIALNRINPNQGASQIFGSLTATGTIVLVNQAGIFFGNGAVVNVGSLIASTIDITNSNFLNKNYIFDQHNTAFNNGVIVNQGTINAADYGLVALVGNAVENDGTIEARYGNVELASGNAGTLQLNDNKLVSFEVTQDTDDTGVDPFGNDVPAAIVNNGKIIVPGGAVYLSANEAEGVVDNAINMKGIIEASSVSQQNGEIILSGGDNGTVTVSGKIIASGQAAGQTGGNVKILGNVVHVQSTAVVNVSGDQGGGTILVGGDARGVGPDQSAETTTVDAGAFFDADAISSGNGGHVVAFADGTTQFSGYISAQGGVISGNGGYVETSGHVLSVDGAAVDLLAKNGTTGTWLLDPTDVTINSSDDTNETYAADTYTPSGDSSNILASELVGNLATSNVTVTTTSGGAGTGNITVSSALSWSSANTLILNATNDIIINAAITALNGGLTLSAANSSQSITTGAAGTINVNNFNLLQGQWYQNTASLPSFTVGNNFQIDSGTMPNASAQFIRVAGGTGASDSPYQLTDIYGVQGIGSNATTEGYSYVLNNDINATGTSTWNTSAGFVPIAAYSGTELNGVGYTINGLTIDLPTTSNVGLFNTNNGTITNLGLTNEVIYGYGSVGGIAGNNAGTISNSYTTGVIVGAPGIAYAEYTGIGGLVGYNAGSLTDSYSSASVSGSGAIGGLVGTNYDTMLSNSFFIGSVKGTGNSDQLVGGLVGYNFYFGTVSDSYSAGYVSASTGDVGGLIGAQYTVSGESSVTGSYWDTASSGQSSAIGNGYYANGTPTAGTFTGNSGLNLTSQASYDGWDFTDTWAIIPGNSYPYLQSINTSTPRVIAGTLASTGGETAILAVAGLDNVDTAYTGANGAFYFLEQNGAVSDSTDILIYLNGATNKSNAVAQTGTSGASIIGLGSSAANMLTVGTNGSETLSNTDLSTAIGSLSSSNLLYSVSSNNLTLTSNVSLNTTDTTTYQLNGNITASGVGALTFNGPLSLSTTSNLTTVDRAINLNGSVNGNFGLSTNTGLGTVTLAGLVGGMTALASLTINGASSVTDINTIAIKTSGAQTYSGTTTLGSTTTLTSTTSDITLTGAVTGAGFGLTISNAGSGGSIANVLSGTGTSLTVTGAGTLTLSDANTYTGATTVNNGILSITNQNALGTGSSSAITVNSGGELSLNLGGHTLGNTSSMSLSGTGTTGALYEAGTSGTDTITNAITLAGSTTIGANTGGTLNLTTGNISNGANLLTFSGAGNFGVSDQIVAGSGGVTMNGSGVLTLSGNNSYTGNTTINGGTISIGADTNLGTAPVGVVANAITFGASGGTLDTTNSFTLNSNRGITLTGSGTMTPSASTTLMYGGVVTGSGGFTLAGAANSSLLVLSGTNSYTGITTINGGTLSIGADLNLGAAPVSVTANSITFGASGGILNTTNSFTLNSNRGITLTGSGTITPSASMTLTYGGVVTGAGGLTLAGAASNSLLILSGTNSYAGITTINGGTLSIGADLNLGIEPSEVTANSITFGASGGTLDTTNSFILNSNRGITLTGAGILTPSASTTLTYGGVVTGAGGLTLAGAASSSNLALKGANTYTGNTTISTGTLSVSNAQGLGTSSGGTITVSNGAELSLNLKGATLSNNQAMNISGTGVSGLGVLYEAGSFGLDTLNNAIMLLGDTTIGVNTGSTLVLGNTVDGAHALTLSGSGGLQLQGVVGGAQPLTSLTTSSVGTTTIGANINTVGAQQYNNDLTLIANAIFTSTASGNFLFNKSVNAGSQTITLATAFDVDATTTLNGAATINTLTGTQTGNNTFNMGPSSDFVGAINGGNANKTNTLNYTNYNSGVTVTFSDQQTGSVNSLSFSHINNVEGSNAGSNTIVMPMSPSQLSINDFANGNFSDPTTFSDFSSINGRDNATVTFNTPVTVDFHRGLATLNDQIMYFTNIYYYENKDITWVLSPPETTQVQNFISQVTNINPSPPVNNPVSLASILNPAPLYSYYTPLTEFANPSDNSQNTDDDVLIQDKRIGITIKEKNVPHDHFTKLTS